MHSSCISSTRAVLTLNAQPPRGLLGTVSAAPTSPTADPVDTPGGSSRPDRAPGAVRDTPLMAAPCCRLGADAAVTWAALGRVAPAAVVFQSMRSVVLLVGALGPPGVASAGGGGR